IIPETIKKQKLARLNRNLEDETVTRPIQDKLAETFAGNADKIAVRYGNTEVTYRSLEQNAAAVTHWINTNNYPKGSYFGIYMENRLDAITLMIGILNAGSVFVPLDTAQPDKRRQRMIQNSATAIVFTDAENEGKLTAHSDENRLQNVNTPQSKIIDKTFYLENPPVPAKEKTTHAMDDHIYVYFTSGTTGTPKAIIGKNKSLLQFIQWEIDTLGKTAMNRVSQLTAIGFDAILRDVFTTICAGGTICIPGNKELILKEQELTEWIDRNRITLIHCVPGIFKIFNTPRLTPAHFAGLTHILLSGEALDPHELINWQKNFGDRIRLLNLYGPTETTMVRTHYLITQKDRHKSSIPIGKPIRGTEMVLLDKGLNICDHGQVGEIYIRTPYVTAGYCNAPQATKDKFIPNPYQPNTGDKLYKTGDLARETGDGNIWLLGRQDKQVKIRGVRIEISGIETTLKLHPRIKEAVVLQKQYENGEKYLCAYYVVNNPIQQADAPQSDINPREHLAQTLPAYMHPDYYIKIDAIPLTPNGKTDRKALAKYPNTQHRAKTRITPRNQLEEQLAAIWADTLNVRENEISIDNDFFQIGGHSLKATVLAANVHKLLNVKLPLAEIFKNPSIITLAKVIEGLAQEKYAAIKPVEKKEYYP
ncbi:MAG: non-ribosomal peptide synthetase, partial [bacterium]|nr:non-ribosomal peptide synthetase [bacterium]